MDFLPSTINILGTEVEVLKLLISIIIISVGFIIAKGISLLITKVLGKYIPDNIEITIRRIIYWGIIAISILSALGNLGVDFTGILLAGGIAGIIIGFATQSIVANLISGLFLHLDKPIKIGDPIEVVGMDVSGVVVDITAFSTRIRRFDGVFVRIPNEKIFTAQLRNFNAYIARRIEITVGIAYKEDMDKALNIIKGLLEKHPKILVEPEPRINVWELGDSSININIWPWVPSSEWINVRSELVKLVKEEFDKHGIEIPFPQRTIWFGK